MPDPDIQIELIKDFWNKNPVGTNFINDEIGMNFFSDYDEFRYKTEPHILKELDTYDFVGKRVLEIGLGQGADSMKIIDRGALFYGIDLTEESIKRVEARFSIFEKIYNELKVAKAEDIPYPDSYFDIIYSHGVIHHSPNIRKIVEEIFRVLKPGGQAIVMLYHKNSINYWVSINFIRRVGLLFLLLFPPLKYLLAKITGEDVPRLSKHLKNFKQSGISYLRMKNFIHKSTDGPDNVYSSVWTSKDARNLFKSFKNSKTKVYFLNERHLLGLQKIMPKSLKQNIARKFGWHLWIISQK